MNEEFYSILLSIGVLGAAAAAALFLTVTRRPRDPGSASLRRLTLFAGIALVLQSGHFIEELLTGFYIRYPEALGLRPMPVLFFVSFNSFWIAAWGLSIIGIRAHLRAAFFPIWFLGIGGIVNLVAHPIFAILERGYFPGLWTSVPSGIAGLFLIIELASYTRVKRHRSG